MDVEKFVKNLEAILKERGISASRAGKESGAGINFVRHMKDQKSAPSYLKVQQMAQYLGMTTSELLCEESSPAAGPGEEAAPSSPDWERAFSELSTEELMQVQEILLKEFGVRIKNP